PAAWGLHFDLTIPFARYVLENSSNLDFPFRRYQLQKAWRGERPQEGRYREFCQADIDVVGDSELPIHIDAEVVEVALAALRELSTQIGTPEALARVNNRRLAAGVFEGLGIADPAPVLRLTDKLAKIGSDQVLGLLVEEAGLSKDTAASVIEFAQISGPLDAVLPKLDALGVENESFLLGRQQLVDVVSRIAKRFPDSVIADMQIARGLDYYTGTIFELVLIGRESLGSISAGGRYDQLASDGKRTYPGVGISIGLSRILTPMIATGELTASRKVPTVVLVAVNDEESRDQSEHVASQLRDRGIACEVSPSAAKFGKQIKYAERRQIPYVWFVSPDGDEVKNLASREQSPANAATWTPSDAELRITNQKEQR
ncbi:MAG: histidine--tRNA ligase, partial [Propionibacterium sp.]